MRLRELDKVCKELEGEFEQKIKKICEETIISAYRKGVKLVDRKTVNFTPEFDFVVGRLLPVLHASYYFYCENSTLDHKELGK